METTHTNTPSTSCPKCKSGSIRRSKRRLFDRITAVTYHYPYRCMTCEHRFYIFRPQRPARTQRNAEVRSESQRRRRAASRREFIIYMCALLAFAVYVAFIRHDRS